MKSDAERGEFGSWLRRERKQRFENVADAVRAMKREEGYSITVSEWAEFEAGTRRPSAERKAALEGFLGAPAPSEIDVSADSQRVQAISYLTDAIREQTAVLQEMLQTMRRDRSDLLSPEAVRLFLRQLVDEGLIARPEPLPEAASNPSHHEQVAGR